MRKYELKNFIPTHEFELAPLADPTPAYTYFNTVLQGQNNLEGVIRAVLAECSCQIEGGTKLVGLEQFEDRVEVKLLRRRRLSDEDETVTTETARYDWVIGAGGAHCTVRKQSTFIFDGETRVIGRLVVGDIHVNGLKQKYWHLWEDASDVPITLRPTEVPGLFHLGIGESF
ncbi:putative FAD binding domain containing protein [Lyophyllum shimeji]|uniref:FAD binding domain containing protein n=1 Tax=Lyophyllum shimeji TaxID=47721 RepID=A0A9P3PTM0_LYOSH|nr:putative FAD binding domain containing protein [Lyophyllum shimeji]